jgi:hypothetical protein
LNVTTYDLGNRKENIKIFTCEKNARRKNCEGASYIPEGKGLLKSREKEIVENDLKKMGVKRLEKDSKGQRRLEIDPEGGQVLHRP